MQRERDLPREEAFLQFDSMLSSWGVQMPNQNSGLIESLRISPMRQEDLAVVQELIENILSHDRHRRRELVMRAVDEATR